mmetsp:Transcript_13097/g.15530  ORF Transcript_13097/g.15530 Transcript_13097/m.15530 type:complete len:160 (+) Transcript_13097:138-617(+)|eukprot:jgi/Bigna1/60593/fgenesh1_kg.13_\
MSESSPAEVFAKISEKDEKSGKWMILSLNKKKKAVVDATGDGLESLRKAFDEGKCSWALFRVHGVDVQENVTSIRPKLVQINWVGEKVSAFAKMGALEGKQKVSKIFKGIACSFDANGSDDVSADEIVKKLCASGGAHKPVYYDFGCDEKIQLEFYQKK